MEEAAQAAVIDETKRKEAADRHEKLLNSLKAFIYSNKYSCEVNLIFILPTFTCCGVLSIYIDISTRRGDKS